MHNGYAVIDFETTGFSPNHGHRIIEIGLVHVAPDGQVERSFETLLNPGRDLGPVHVHQIRGRDVAEAPTFADVAGTLIELLRGRVLVAHNARFEATFLAAELARLGHTSPIGAENALCTMQLASTFLPGSGRKLADCCNAYDIELVNAHEALADATATALLLGAYMEASRGAGHWQDWTTRSSALVWPVVETVETRWVARRRSASVPSATLLDRATDLLPSVDDDLPAQQYLAMLDAALADGLLSVHETDQLADLARQLHIGDDRRVALHDRYFADLVAAAWADSVLSEDERREIETVGTLLDIGASTVAAAMHDPRPMATAPAPQRGDDPELTLNGSSLVVLTGEMRRSRNVIEADLARLGIPTARAVTKKTTLVIAADVDSLSGKARKAAQYGIPIASEGALEAALAHAAV
uniref:Exonuclease domain-containing protein n=1 Tax=Neobacillus citreus TaxID=2833578 RepID=A0A942T1T9_9BACI